jgi:hypothetical protein
MMRPDCRIIWFPKKEAFKAYDRNASSIMQ